MAWQSPLSVVYLFAVLSIWCHGGTVLFSLHAGLELESCRSGSSVARRSVGLRSSGVAIDSIASRQAIKVTDTRRQSQSRAGSTSILSLSRVPDTETTALGKCNEPRDGRS